MLTPVINIRYADITDASAIAKVHVLSWQKTYRGHIPDNILDALSTVGREQQWRYLMDNALKILVLERNNKVIGFASICAARDTDLNPKLCGEISAFYLHPDYWHQGLGTLLCESALTELSQQGFVEVTLWVLTENRGARKFYSIMGFNDTGITKTDVYFQKIALHETRYLLKMI
jgi:ribosomal protein S18 acetylase RimI-like enzyme